LPALKLFHSRQFAIRRLRLKSICRQWAAALKLLDFYLRGSFCGNWGGVIGRPPKPMPRQTTGAIRNPFGLRHFCALDEARHNDFWKRRWSSFQLLAVSRCAPVKIIGE
jgi:hypothetical protein